MSKWVLFVLLLSVLSQSAPVRAPPVVHLSVPQAPLSVGQPVYIEYYTDPGGDGTISLDITRPPLLAILWMTGPNQIGGGLLYSVTAPGLTDPGTYLLSATVNLLAGGTLNGQTTFEVVGGAGFDFNIELVPPSVTVQQGGTAHYDILLTYSSPAYSGTTISIQVTGLGPSINYQVIQNPPSLLVSTSQFTPPGAYSITMIGSASGKVHQTTANLIVTGQQAATTTGATTATAAFDFALAISPSSQTVEMGKSTAYTITVSVVNGQAIDPVSLQVEGLPESIERVFSMQEGVPPFSSTLTLTMSPQGPLPSGSYTMTVIATGAGKTKTATATLIVQERPKQTPQITITAFPRDNEAIEVQGSISPPIFGEAHVEIMYTGPAGERIVHEVPIRGGDVFNDMYQAPTPGMWTVVAHWQGNDEYMPASSQPVNVQIESRFGPSTILDNPSYLAIIILAIVVAALIIVMLRRRAPAPSRTQTSALKYCPSCGAPLSLGKPFCSSCGKPVEE